MEVNAVIENLCNKFGVTVDYLLRGGEFRESDGIWHPYRGLGYWFIIEYANK